MGELSPACPAACAGSEVSIAADWPLPGKFAAYCCGTCGLLFSWPQPDTQQLSDYYGPTGPWATQHVAPKLLTPQKTKGKAGRALIGRLEALLPHPPRRVLDFGCGTGRWLNAFADAGWETWGIEPATDVAFERHVRLQTVPEDGSFDCVMAYHVLEHLPRPLETLIQFRKALRPRGVCIVSVPRLDTVLVHQDRSYCLNGHAHLVAFTEACLRDLFRRAGFAHVEDAHDMDALFTKGRPVRMRLIAHS
jgi:SAM-dependent methyltransferase